MTLQGECTPWLKTRRDRTTLLPMSRIALQEMKRAMRDLYLEDPRPWLVGFSGGKDSTVVGPRMVESSPLPR
jgi:3'-phosphoadenosine 5'-phosphosulfate sulfotransferase (PAPS reductase)/FAD synthetase